MARLISYGAAEEVTGSKHLLEVGKTRILVDCGIFQGRRAEARRKNEEFPFSAGAVGHCINTHGHLDHCGAYPLLVKNGFRGEILSTSATRDIAGLVMMDSAKIMANDVRFLEKKKKKHPDRNIRIYDPLYDQRDVKNTLSQFVTRGYHRPYRIAPDVRATFYDAGHILGSSLVHLEIQRDGKALSLGFTGDLGRKEMPIIRDPELLPPVDYLVCESTYGNRLHDDIVVAEDELTEVICRTVAEKGRVIIPAFAVERTQELVYILHRLHRQGRIPKIPVFVDSPMAVSATGIFKSHPECYDKETVEEFLDHDENPFSFDSLIYVKTTEMSKAINDMKEPCIVIATSGMCEAGRILHHLIHGIGDARNTILIVGFMAANTLGRRLADKEPEVRIFGRPHEVKARVKIMNTFSAHADYREIGDYVTALDRDRLKAVYLVHGEPEAQEALTRYLLTLGVPRVEIMRAGIPVDLV